MSEPIDYRCAWCNGPIDRFATSCPTCGGVALRGCSNVLRRGRRYVLGAFESHAIAIWDTAKSADPYYWAHPSDLDKMQQMFTDWEGVPVLSGKPSSFMAQQRVSFIILAVLAVVAYVAIHAYRYHGCLIQPGITSWPSQCL